MVDAIWRSVHSIIYLNQTHKRIRTNSAGKFKSQKPKIASKRVPLV